MYSMWAVKKESWGCVCVMGGGGIIVPEKGAENINHGSLSRPWHMSHRKTLFICAQRKKGRININAL